MTQPSWIEEFDKNELTIKEEVTNAPYDNAFFYEGRLVNGSKEDEAAYRRKAFIQTQVIEKLIFDASQAALKCYDPDMETFNWKEMEQQLRSRWLN